MAFATGHRPRSMKGQFALGVKASPDSEEKGVGPCSVASLLFLKHCHFKNLKAPLSFNFSKNRLKNPRPFSTHLVEYNLMMVTDVEL